MNEMKQNSKEIMSLYENYMMLMKVIEGTAYLSDDGILIETEEHVTTGNRKEASA